MAMHTTDQLLEKSWKQIAGVTNVTPASILKDQDQLTKMLQQEWLSGVVVDARGLAVDSIRLALVAYKNQGEDPWPVICSSLSNLYWVHEISMTDFVRENGEWDCGDSSIYERCFFHAMMLQARAPHVADWIAPFMLNKFRQGGWFDADKEFGRFYTFLLEAQLSGQWKPQAAIDHKLAPGVLALFQALPDAAALPAALQAYCDWRLARTNRYPDFASTKKKQDYAFGQSWWGVFPFELFAVQAIYQRCTGVAVSLEAAHPLLQSVLMHPPALYPLPETPESPRLAAFAKKVFGGAWQPLTPVGLV
jgi:hypothetical protein